jgi:hypothetical protein
VMIIRRKPTRDERYKCFIRSLWCLVCGSPYPDPCHTGPHGMRQKADDHTCIPLCRRHHQEYDASPTVFSDTYGLDIPKIVARLNARPVMRILGNRYVTWFEGEEYVLRPVSDGPALSYRCAVALWRERLADIMRVQRAKGFAA